MSARLAWLCLALGLVCGSGHARDGKSVTSPWLSVKKPAKGPPDAIGFYAAGCLRGAQALPQDGPGYQVMRPTRNRYYGHPMLLEFIARLAEASRAKGLGSILIGDMSLPRGGPTLSGHASHQNGLDADIWYWHPKGDRKLSTKERNAVSAPSMVWLKLNAKIWFGRIASS